MSSLLGLLFDHPRHPAASLIEPLCDQPPIVVVVDRPSPVPAVVVQSLLQETAAIWKPLGVDVRSAPDPRDAGFERVVHVLWTDERAPHDVVDQRLGWIRFQSGRPESVIHLSRAAAIELLDANPTLRDQPDAYREQLVARMLGRALAHELGHYLLESTSHTSAGLMRARLSTDALVATERPGFQ